MAIAETCDLVVFPPVTVSSDLSWTGFQLPESCFGGMAVQTRHRGVFYVLRHRDCDWVRVEASR